MVGESKVVCVTGAAGYIASWLVRYLLERGYTVRATVRDPTNAKKTSHLMSMEGAKERLHLYRADLLVEGSFDHIIDGCDGVFHTASPFFHNVTDPQTELIDPAVKGTLNVLASCAKFSSVKRVVYTSSMAAVTLNGKPVSPDVVIDETWFSDPQLCEKNKAWYMLSKTLSEEEAWKFAKEKGIEMVAVNPGLVFGPLLQPTLNTSAASILDLINGAEKYLNITHRYVDVRDVAEAHILAYENPSASGRYCLVGTVIHASDILKVLATLYPGIELPRETIDGKPPTPGYQVSRARAESLGLKYTPFEVSLKDTVESLKEKNFVQKSF